MILTMGLCSTCRHWKVVSEAETCREGVCQNLSHSSWHGGWQLTDAAGSCEQWTEIAYFQANDGTMHVERRIAERATVDFPAQLKTPGGTRNLRLVDVSETGARLQASDTPKPGMAALIQIGPREMFCRVAWSRDGHCGISFDKPLPRELIVAITGRAPGFQAPTAMPLREPQQRKSFGVRGLAQPLQAMAKP
jgi:hypothetical protein